MFYLWLCVICVIFKVPMCNILSYAMWVTYSCYVQFFTGGILHSAQVHDKVPFRIVSYRIVTVRYSRIFSSFLHSRFCCCRWFIRVVPAQLKVNTHFITFHVLPQLCKTVFLFFSLYFHSISCAYFQPPYLFSIQKCVSLQPRPDLSNFPVEHPP